MVKKKSKKRWIKFRHKLIRYIALPAFHIYMKIRYGVKIDKVSEKRQYFIISNHQTAYDQFFLDVAFKGSIYYLASEDLFSSGFVSKIIKYLVAPIPIKKSVTDVRAVMNTIRVAREGGTIAVFPEGNRTFGGETGYVKEAISGLAKSLKLPIAVFRIEGGYGVHPRWSDVIRRGKMHCYLKEVIEPQDYLTLSDEELYALICDKLYHNEGKKDGLYFHKKSAEYLERAIYYCPECGISEWYSHNDTTTCKKCGMKVKYLPSKELEGENFPYRFVTEWYDAQCKFMNSLDLAAYNNGVCSDTANFYEVIPYKEKCLVSRDAEFSLFGDRYEIKGESFSKTLFFKDISAVSVLGKNKLNIYEGTKIYQIKSHKRFCAVKYMNFYYRFVNIRKGDENGKFLGL